MNHMICNTHTPAEVDFPHQGVTDSKHEICSDPECYVCPVVGDQTFINPVTAEVFCPSAAGAANHWKPLEVALP